MNPETRIAPEVCAEQGHSVNLANSQFGVCRRCRCLLYPWSRKDQESQDRCFAEWQAEQSKVIAAAMERSKPLVADALKLGRSLAGVSTEDEKLVLK